MAVGNQVVTEKYAIYEGDCCKVIPHFPDASIHLSIYSPPFCGLFQYSSDPADMSNCVDYNQFFDHYSYLVSEIYRVTKPGRMSAVHSMDIPSGNTGTDHLTDFPGDIIRLHVRCRKPSCKSSEMERQNGKCGHGWFDFIARYAIWKEPLAVRNRTMAKNLAHKTIVEDSSRCSVASADYLLVFRRKGKNEVPIKHPVGLLEYAGSRKIPAELLRYRGWKGNQIQNRYSHWIWRNYASAFWDDIRIGRVMPFKEARESEDEKHIHPLQLDVVERVMTLWSNPGENVLTPYMGSGGEVCGAIANGRRGIGVELKPSYFRQSVKNCANVEARGWGDDDKQEELFDEEAVEETEDEVSFAD